MSKRFLLVLAACAVGLGLLFVLTKDKASAPDVGSTVGSNHIDGNPQSKVTFVEYGDFQCPICGQYYPLVKELKAKYQDKVSFQFRNLPLFQIHPNAFAAARAAEAAGLQNKFWEMHDLLFENQSSWSGASNPIPFFDAYAKQLGLNTAKFKADYASKQVNDLINGDVDAYNKTGEERATPAFFINGKKIQNKADVNYFSQQIDQALKDQQ